MMANKEHVNITLDPSILSWIDTLRGQEPRSTFINKILNRICAQTQEVFNWEEEGAKSEKDIKNGHVRKFHSSQEALQWLKS